VNQIAIGNKFGLSGASESNKDDSIELSHKVYFTRAGTTSQASRRCRSLGLSIVRIVYGAQVKLYYINELELAYRFKTLGVRKKSTLRKFFRARMALPR
jgi:hypothetical protein